ncbi:hypothetical protein ANO11243_013940 [Dothideomycetidae sp. 11243]|nr:hypothetical protein ANO11243_013940 [fungal sp. No.11243]
MGTSLDAITCRRIGRAGSKQEHDGLPTGEEVSSAPRTIHDARPVKELKLSSGLRDRAIASVTRRETRRCAETPACNNFMRSSQWQREAKDCKVEESEALSRGKTEGNEDAGRNEGDGR